MDQREEIGRAADAQGRPLTIVRTQHDRPPLPASDKVEFFSVEGDASSVGFGSIADVRRYLGGWGDEEYETLDPRGAAATVTRPGLGLAAAAVSWRPDWHPDGQAPAPADPAPADSTPFGDAPAGETPATSTDV